MGNMAVRLKLRSWLPVNTEPHYGDLDDLVLVYLDNLCIGLNKLFSDSNLKGFYSVKETFVCTFNKVTVTVWS